jgi:release factor glutamine methyltransferase
MSGAEAMRVLVARLRSAGCVFAEDEAALLTEAVDDPDAREALVCRRIAGEPLEQVLGWAAFDGMRLVVTPGVFVPRSRTVALARRASALVPRGRAAVALDLCCGVGAVAAVLARDHPGLELVAADVDAGAATCARANLPDGALVVVGDLFAAVPPRLRGLVDVMTANAPYVPTSALATMPSEARLHERATALDGGPDGLDVHRRIAEEARVWLRPGGSLLIETSAAQAPAAVALLTAGGLVARREHDDELDATVVIGVRRG